jgi:KDO2-lipid IV(A) lauroyltransferase
VLGLISRLPLRVLYLLADFIYLIANHVVAYRKDVVYQNLRNTYPAKSESEIRQIADGFYHHLCDLLVESLKAMSISAEDLCARVKLNGIEIIEDYLQRDQAVILMVAHQCNLEWLLLASGARLGQPVHVVYKPLHDKRIDRLMLKTRSRFGGKPVPARDVFLEVAKNKRTMKAVALAPDQAPQPEEEKYWTQFLNQQTAFFVGSEKLAKITKFPVIFAAMRRVRRGVYEVDFSVLAEPPYNAHSYTVLEQYAKETEHLINQDPSTWLWSHRRWKLKKPLYA